MNPRLLLCGVRVISVILRNKREIAGGTVLFRGTEKVVACLGVLAQNPGVGLFVCLGILTRNPVEIWNASNASSASTSLYFYFTLL